MNTYLEFISDEDLMKAIDTLYKTYARSFKEKTLKELNKNIIDPFKFQFDTLFLNGGRAEKTLSNEIFRQSDKSIANAIGLFHQQLLGSIEGFVETPELPCDVKKCDNTIFAEIKNKHNTMNVRSSSGVYEELEGIAKSNPKAMCYLIEIVAKKSSDEVWKPTINEKTYEHPRIHKISADRFYELATGDKYAFYKLCKVLPKVAWDYLERNLALNELASTSDGNAYKELVNNALEDQVGIFDEMFKYTLPEYHGFRRE